MQFAGPKLRVDVCTALLGRQLPMNELSKAHPLFQIARVEQPTEAAKHILKLAKYVELKFWSGLMDCCLINGVVPPEKSLENAGDQLVTFDVSEVALIKVVPLSKPRIHHIRAHRRAWRYSDEAQVLVTPADFFDWCEAEEIDTNYLRLLCEIAGFGSDRLMGTLLYRDIEYFKGV